MSCHVAAQVWRIRGRFWYFEHRDGSETHSFWWDSNPAIPQTGTWTTVLGLEGKQTHCLLIETSRLVSGLTGAQVLLSWCRKDSAWGKVMGKEWIYQSKMLVRDTSRQARECSSEDKEGCIFIIKEKVGSEEDHLLSPKVDIKAYIISFSFVPIWSNRGCCGAI